MQPRLEATLADFVPALRFLPPDRVDRHLGHPGLPPAWWTSVPISRAVDAIGAAELPDRLADLAYGELRHLRLGDLLPAAWLARNDFRLSQWPDAARTNVLVRTPDWADLLTATVQEIGDWTQIGTSTVRPVISQLFAEVLGLLPDDARTVGAPAVPDGAADDSVADSVAGPAEERVEESGEESVDASIAGGSGETPAEGAESAAEALAEAPVSPPSPRGIRISKRPPVTPVDESAADPEPESEPPSVAHEAQPAYAGYGDPSADSGLEPVSDLLDAIEDELRPVSMPAPPTGDLGDVVRWLAEEAPDVPLMSELARVTLETVAVVGIEGAPPEVRTALLRLTSLVPETLLPEGLDVSEDALAVPGAELEDPYNAPEMTAMLGAVRPDDAAFAPDTAADDEPESGSASDARSDSRGEPERDARPAFGADDLTMLAMPAATSEPPRVPPVGADDLTMLAMPTVTAADGGDEGIDDGAGHPDHAADSERRDDSEDSGAHPCGGAFDGFGEVPPATREDRAVRPEAPREPADDAMDAFGEIPPATREDLPAQPAPRDEPRSEPRDGRDAAEGSVDAFGEIPPSTRDDIPVPSAARSREPEVFASPPAFHPQSGKHTEAQPDSQSEWDADEVLDPTSLGVGPSWIRGGGAKALPGQGGDSGTAGAGDDAGAGDTDDEVTVEVDSRPIAADTAEAVPDARDPRAEAAAAKAAAAARAEAAQAEKAGRSEAAAHSEASALPETQQPAGAVPDIVIPPKPTQPPPIPPRPTTAPPVPGGDVADTGGAGADVGAATAIDHGADSVEGASSYADSDDTPAPVSTNIVMVLAGWFSGREPRWRTLARDRLFTDSPRELSSIAAEFDKDTAEVAALERALRQHLHAQLDEPGGSQVREHLAYVRDSLGPVATVAELRELDDRHSASVPGLGVQLWQVVRGLLDLNTSADGWITAGAPGELESRTSEIVGAACERDGSAPLAALEPPLSALGVRVKVREAWIARLDGFEIADGVVRPWPRDESGEAAAVPETGENEAAAATVEAARPDPDPGSGTGSGTGPEAAFGSEPGMPSWTAPGSAAAPAEPDPDADPGEAARCFRDDQGVWWYRVDVDMPLIDGERLPLPPQFVLSLGLRPDQGLRLHHAAGPAALRWEREPYCVSLRAILAGLGAEDGDMVFIGSVRPGRLETRLLAGDGKLRLPRWARALRHTGVDPVPDQVNLPALLGARLGLDANCDLKAVLKRLQDRGDADVLELLGVAPAR
ncbi:hypothetical protein [Streptodolium elevatio]|uniref:Uncharacterized protein n=1 Tax=Streptodolium elevatio TaxID=3157996 RepID=A0ABV3DB16_9ACTN